MDDQPPSDDQPWQPEPTPFADFSDEEKVEHVRAIFDRAERHDDIFNSPPPNLMLLAERRASERRVQSILDKLIRNADRWLAMDRGERERGPGEIVGPYLRVHVAALLESIDIATSYTVGGMNLKAYWDLKRMLEDEDVRSAEWPDGLTERRVAELRFYADALYNHLGPIAPEATEHPKHRHTPPSPDPDEKTPEALIHFMEGRETATYDEVIAAVHGALISADSIRSNISRANEILEDQQSDRRLASRKGREVYWKKC